uniref:T9SS type A sorting domain-containing protein n=1 Tax=Hydrotalea sp. TaxID=2881279 RepID=UPI00260DB8DC
VGAPVITSVTSSMTGSCNGTYQEWFLNAITNSAVTSWLWTVDNPANSNWVIYSPNQPNTLVAVTGGGGITISATNACGTGKGGVTIWSNCYAPYALTASPNPASGNINVRVKEAVDTTVTAMRSKALAVSGTNGITKMHLYNFYTGLLVKEWTYQETESDNYNLNIVGVQAGLYVLEMERNNKMCSVKVIVK